MSKRANASTSDRIIAAALALIGERGLRGVTMSEIADVAGIARQTLYNHYRDVESIVAEATERHGQESIELLERTLGIADGPPNKLEQLVRHVAAMGGHGHQVLDLQDGLPAEARAALALYDDALNNHIRAILAAGMQAGLFRLDLSPDLDSVLVRRLLDGVVELVTRSPDESARIVTNGIRTLLSAVALRQ